jgi:hypothetical protein
MITATQTTLLLNLGLSTVQTLPVGLVHARDVINLENVLGEDPS